MNGIATLAQIYVVEAAVLAYNNLVKNLAPHGYKPSRHSTGLWYHETRKTNFCFCVDDFWVKYFKPEDAQHLLDTLELFYTISVDMEGRNYCGLTIDWNYSKGYVDISMPGYILKVLHKLQHPTPSRPQYSPHQWNRPIYGKTRQFAPLPDESSRLDKSGIKRVQTVVGCVLYYTRGIDNTMLTALNEIGTEQAKATTTTNDKTNHLLDYCCTYTDSKIRYYASDMVLWVDSDAAYLVLPGAKSRIAGTAV